MRYKLPILLVLALLCTGCALAKKFREPRPAVFTEEARREAEAAGYVNQALQLFHNNKFLDRDEAMKLLTKAVELNPKSAQAHYFRGLVLSIDGQSKAALRDLDIALKIKPGAIRAVLLRGKILWKLGRDEEAVRDFTKVLKLSPNMPEAYSLRGATLARLGKDKEALKDLKDALSMDPSLYEPYFNMGLIHSRQQRYEEAARNFTQAIIIRPNAQAFARRGVMFMNLKRYGQAVSDLKIASELKSKDLEYLKLLASAYQKGGDKNGAFEALSKGLAIARAERNTSSEMWFRQAIRELDK